MGLVGYGLCLDSFIAGRAGLYENATAQLEAGDIDGALFTMNRIPDDSG